MRRTLLSLGGLIMLGITLLPRSGGAESAAADCSAPAEIIQDDPQFPDLARRLAEKAPVTIVVLGGSSTVGAAAGDGDAAYPHQLEMAMRRRFPDVPITVINKGVQRQTAQQMAARLKSDVIAANPALVLWEVGTTDAVRATDIDAFAQTLQDGIAELREHGIGVMLIDAQYSPDTSSVINFEPYLNAVHQAGDLSEAYVFRRYDVMKYWSDNGVFSFTDVPQSERSTLAARVYACLGERLADAIIYATR